ncbi:MAG: LemA family protein [Prevotellaceae bacterium]|jgi:LemA protein|nr:LemA family protein [Prevotellaceae bacterium]
MDTGLIIVLGVAGLLLIVYIVIYNGLVSRKNQVEYADGAVNVMFKNRYDLIPNLVAAVKQYMQHERGLLEKLTELRSGATDRRHWDVKQMNEWEQQYKQTMKAFNITVENYPNLKAAEQFSQLQVSLNECEAQLAAARRTYNAAVMDYNNGLEMFPSNIVASMMHYKRKDMIEATQQERQVPNVGSLFA